MMWEIYCSSTGYYGEVWDDYGKTLHATRIYKTERAAQKAVLQWIKKRTN